MVVAGTWSPSEGLTVSDPAAYKRDPPPNVTLTVVTVEVSREIENKNSISFHCNHLHYYASQMSLYRNCFKLSSIIVA